MKSSEISSSASMSLVDFNSKIRLKRVGDKLFLYLPQNSEFDLELNWTELCNDLSESLHLQGNEGKWSPDTVVYLIAKNQLIDGRKLQQLATTLGEVELKLTWVSTSRRQTAVAAATGGYCVEQQSTEAPLTGKQATKNSLPLAEPLYISSTIRSGKEIRHPGTVIITGDINPGGTIIAQGNILIWGRLRGIAHAGAQGDRQCCIMSLKMEPTQLRIADLVARAPDNQASESEPEVAYINKQGICISQAINFAKAHYFSQEEQVWLDSQTQIIDY